MYSCLTEFNEEAFRKDIHDEGYDAGVLDTTQKFIKILMKNNIPKDIAISELIEEFQISKKNAINLVNKYWK